MTTPPEHDHLASRLASLAEALVAQSDGGRGPFERPEWELLVRRRGQLDLVAVEDAPGMGPIDDWEIAHPKIGRLFSTAVIEVGIDIPNASTIVIDGAERFGLAQLHQFRGRGGRGQHQSFCILVSDKDDTAVTKQRPRAM